MIIRNDCFDEFLLITINIELIERCRQSLNKTGERIS